MVVPPVAVEAVVAAVAAGGRAQLALLLFVDTDVFFDPSQEIFRHHFFPYLEATTGRFNMVAEMVECDFLQIFPSDVLGLLRERGKDDALIVPADLYPPDARERERHDHERE